jgi:RsiW-degrading membrane proteinase PrsW (M82 family)
MQASPDTATPDGGERGWGWRQTLLTGLLLWIASVVVTALTENVLMIPTVVLLGSFLVPATAVDWYLDHYRSDLATPARVTRAFILGGGFGVIGATVLEALFLPSGLLVFSGAALIEELVKLLGLLLVARHLPCHRARDGIVLGAAVGFGFAALESSGYALSALLVREGQAIVLSLGSLVSTEIVRGFLAPLGHGLWTAIVGGALFAASGEGRPRVSWSVVAAYLAVVLLHASWDSMWIVAMVLSALYLGAPTIGDPWLGTLVPPAAEQALAFYGFFFGGLTILSLIGMAMLQRRWHAEEPEPDAPPPGLAASGPVRPGAPSSDEGRLARQA